VLVLPERTDVLVGSMLGKDYHVLKPIGAGGMAVVYLVEHQTLLKQFAAKVLSSELASSLEARARFTQEAHASSQLDHENIVSISDFGVTVDQRPFFVMELLRGQTLDQRLAEGPMSIEEVVAIAVPVARALAYAHAEGIVHLDVKPENIFLVQRRHGRWGVKVVDFGIAKTPLTPRLTKPGETSGSPMFMAPEVCRGDEDIDQRADVYSFGILLYLMMCGRLPFVDDNLHRVLEMQLVELPPPPREVNAELSPELAAIIERALAKRPEDRYPSMEALLHHFEAALPVGADRLLIEAQSGTTVRNTPFAGALSIARHDTPSSPSRVVPTSSSSGIPSSPASAMSWSSPSAVSSSPRSAPPRRRAPLVLAAAIAGTLVGGVLLWRWSATAPAAEVRADNPSAPGAPANLPAPPTAVAAAPPAEVAPPAPTASDDRVVAPAADDRDPAPAGVAEPPRGAEEPAAEPSKAERTATAKQPPVRPKSVPRQPARQGKRVAVIGPAGAPAAPHPGASSPGSLGSLGSLASSASPALHAVDAEAGSVASEVSGAHEPAAGPVPPPVPVAPVTPPAPTRTGTLDATPAIVTLEVKGSLSPSIVRRSVDRTLAALRACYRTAARAGSATPAVELQLTFEIDENRLATQIATRGASFGSLASCATGVMSQIRTSEAPDVGTAQVTVVIRFRPS